MGAGARRGGAAGAEGGGSPPGASVKTPPLLPLPLPLASTFAATTATATTTTTQMSVPSASRRVCTGEHAAVALQALRVAGPPPGACLTTPPPSSQGPPSPPPFAAPTSVTAANSIVESALGKACRGNAPAAQALGRGPPPGACRTHPCTVAFAPAGLPANPRMVGKVPVPKSAEGNIGKGATTTPPTPPTPRGSEKRARARAHANKLFWWRTRAFSRVARVSLQGAPHRHTPAPRAHSRQTLASDAYDRGRFGEAAAAYATAVQVLGQGARDDRCALFGWPG